MDGQEENTRSVFYHCIVPLIIACACNQDARLAGGYENVPTVDIHMNQVCAMVKPRVTYS